jgi:single-stranded DNA-binding protein
MIRTITVTGNLGRDPEEVRGDRRTFAKASLAVSQGKEKPTIWFDLTAWGQYEIKDLMRCSKGDRITASGKIELREYSDRDGNPRQSLGIALSGLERHEREDRRQVPAPRDIAPHPAGGDDIPF